MLSRLLRDQIDSADVVLCILPEGRFAGTEGELQLRYAVERGKPVILFRDEGREYLPVPEALKGDRDLMVVDGDLHRLARLIPEFLETPPGGTIVLIDGPWGHGAMGPWGHGGMGAWGHGGR